jgi:hypothetical protein
MKNMIHCLALGVPLGVLNFSILERLGTSDLLVQGAALTAVNCLVLGIYSIARATLGGRR